MNQRGVALITVLVLLTLLLPLGAAAVLDVRMQGLMTRNRRARAISFEVAEAGLAHAIAEAERAIGPGALLDGPATATTNAQESTFPFRRPPLSFALAQAAYRVAIVADGPSRLRLTSSGTFADGKAIITALLAIGPPYSPAAVYVDGDESTTLPSSYVVSVESGERTTHVRSPTDVPPLAIEDVVAMWRHHAQSSVVTIATDSTELGDETHPRLVFASGGLTIATSGSGAGVLVVEGPVQLRGMFRFRGLLVLRRGGELAPGSRLEVEGGLWIDRSRDHDAFALNGEGTVRYSAAALANVERAMPLAIPRQIQFSGWEEGE